MEILRKVLPEEKAAMVNKENSRRRKNERRGKGEIGVWSVKWREEFIG